MNGSIIPSIIIAFLVAKTNERTDLMFELIVTNEKEISSEPDEVIITVKPIVTPPPPPLNEVKTISDLIKSIIENPLDIPNYIESVKRDPRYSNRQRPRQ